MPPKKQPKPQTVIIDKETGKPSVSYGPWDAFKPTENAGYSWFQFDVTNWLTSTTVKTMSLAEQGLYIKALAIQWRDGDLMADPTLFAYQVGCDRRTAASFLNLWGSSIFTCVKHPWSTPEARMRHGCDMDAAWSQHERGKDVASTQRKRRPHAAKSRIGCNVCVNGYLRHLALSKGVPGIGLGTDIDGEGDVDGNGDGDTHSHRDCVVVSSFSTKEPLIFDEAKHGCFRCNQSAVKCTCRYECIDNTCDFISTGVEQYAAHLRTDHGLWLRLEKSWDGSNWMPYDPNHVEDDDDDLV